MLLGIEAARRHPGFLANNALLAAMDELPETRTLVGHRARVGDASFSPDGTRVLTASDDGTARIWNAATGEVLSTLDHGEIVRSASFSSDGKLAITSRKWIARIWKVETGEPVSNLAGYVRGFGPPSFSPDDTRVLTGTRAGRVGIWNVAIGVDSRMLPTIERYMSAQYARLSPDGTRVLTVSKIGPKIEPPHIRNVETGDLECTLSGPVSAATFSPDGRRIITAADDGVARIWNVETETGKVLATIEGCRVERAFFFARFSPDGTRFLTVSKNGPPRISNAETGDEISTLQGSAWNVSSWSPVSFSPDGTRIVIASFNQDPRVWNVETGALERTLKGHGETVTSASFSPDGTRVVTASSDGTARIWSVGNGAAPTTRPMGVLITTEPFTADGTPRVATRGSNREVDIWNIETRERVSTLEESSGVYGNPHFSADGGRILLFDPGDGTARIWNAETGRFLYKLEESSQFTSVELSADGTRVVTANEERVVTTNGDAVRIWRVRIRSTETGEVRFERALESRSVRKASVSSDRTRVPVPPAPGPYWKASFSPDGSRVLVFASSLRTTPSIWHPETDNTVRLEGVVTRPTRGLLPSTKGSFSSDGRLVLISSATEDVVPIWNVETGKLVAELRGHGEPVSFASFSPDGSRVVTLGKRIVRIWNATSGEVVATLGGHVEFFGVASFSPDGSHVLARTRGSTHVWNVETGEAVYAIPTFGFFSRDGSAVVGPVLRRSWPLDPLELLRAAVKRKPRDLTPKERELFDLPE